MTDRNVRDGSAVPGSPPAIDGSAWFSPCGRYRYRLDRRLGTGPVAAVIMVNPSAADAARDDPTIRRVVGFGRRAGWGRIIVVNLFARIASRTAALGSCDDPEGPDNPTHLRQAIDKAELCVAAWGRPGKLPLALRGAWCAVERLTAGAGKPLHCWAITGGGHPSHPLYLPRDCALRRWNAPARSLR